MNNMRRGFTMIELVFVIVIIGILAAVALPRFTGIADDARTSKLESFTGTLNRTTGPSLWSGYLRNFPTKVGVFADSAGTNNKYQYLFDSNDAMNAIGGVNAGDAQIETIPTEFGTTNMDMTTCMDQNSTDAQIFGNTAGLASADVANTTYHLICVDGSLTSSPHFYLHNEARIITK